MASLVYDLDLAWFDAGPSERLATYTDHGAHGSLTVSLTEDELLAEFGQVPAYIRVIVQETGGTPPASAWLDGPR